MPTCREIVASIEDPKRFALELDRAAPACGCEGHVLGDDCHGPINDDEWLVRFVTDNAAVEPDYDRLISDRFNVMMSSGASVCRAIAPEEEIRLQIENLIHPIRPDRMLMGLVLLRASDVRNWRYEPPADHDDAALDHSGRTVCAYATDAEGCKFHGDLLMTFAIKGKPAKTFDRKRRKAFVEAIEHRYERVGSVDDAVRRIRSLG